MMTTAKKHFLVTKKSKFFFNFKIFFLTGFFFVYFQGVSFLPFV